MKKTIILFVLFTLCLQLPAQIYDDYIGGGHSEGIIVTSSDPQSEGVKSLNGEGLELEIQGASRFLAHTTLGATMDEIKNVTEMGMESWIDDQLLIPQSNYLIPTIEIIYELYDRCMETLGDECADNFNVNTFMWRYAWWHNTMNGEDKLRQRVAMALSEILVISDRSELESYPHAIAYYYDILMKNAFGNYKDLLIDVSLSPEMGYYLSHFNNPKSIPILNITPDENYAREIMQLFTIGLYELNQNGTRKVDMSTGLWIPTYDNDDVKELAKVFTGFSGGAWENENNNEPVVFGQNFRAYSFLDQMKMYENWHEPGAKTIVGDYTIPAGQTGMEDVLQSIDHLFNHDNVGPFLATRLIQRLVKSNPSTDYVSRIAAVFADNGEGVRGDLAAVVKAIFLDFEALECYWMEDQKNGMLRSPMLRYTQMMIGLQARTESDWFWNSGAIFNQLSGQHILSSPTVFNFYTPDYVPDAEFAYLNMVGPEYQILNSSTSSNYVNWMLIALMQEYFRDNFAVDLPDYMNESFFIPYTEDVESYRAYLSDELWLNLAATPDEMVDYLDILLTNGQLSEDKKIKLVEGVSTPGLFNDRERAHYGLFMTMIDPDFVIMK